jgi:hypothetical protein
LTLSEVHFVWRAVQNYIMSSIHLERIIWLVKKVTCDIEVMVVVFNATFRNVSVISTFHIYNYIFTLLSKYNKKTKSISFSIVYHCTSLWVCILMSENSTRSWSDCIVVQLIGQVAILIYVMVFQWLVAGRLFQVYHGCQFYWWRKPEYP